MLACHVWSNFVREYDRITRNANSTICKHISDKKNWGFLCAGQFWLVVGIRGNWLCDCMQLHVITHPFKHYGACMSIMTAEHWLLNYSTIHLLLVSLLLVMVTASYFHLSPECNDEIYHWWELQTFQLQSVGKSLCITSLSQCYCAHSS